MPHNFMSSANGQSTARRQPEISYTMADDSVDGGVVSGSFNLAVVAETAARAKRRLARLRSSASRFSLP